ncbi:hypothetical protein B0H13DRAFT_642537 [Mycena leptocephala]|nr:hypothetical protein B0H13DRAFT_642537 [Mycena leptocephala]
MDREGGRGGEAASSTVLQRARTRPRWIWTRAHAAVADFALTSFGWARPRLFRRCSRRHFYSPHPLRIPPYPRPLHSPPRKPTPPLSRRLSFVLFPSSLPRLIARHIRSRRTRRPTRRPFFVRRATRAQGGAADGGKRCGCAAALGEFLLSGDSSLPPPPKPCPFLHTHALLYLRPPHAKSHGHTSVAGPRHPPASTCLPPTSEQARSQEHVHEQERERTAVPRSASMLLAMGMFFARAVGEYVLFTRLAGPRGEGDEARQGRTRARV